MRLSMLSFRGARAPLLGLALLAFHGQGLDAAQLTDAADSHLLVLNKGDDSLMFLDPQGHNVRATIPVGREPHEISVTPDGLTAYVSNVKDRSLSVVDVLARRVVRTIRPEMADFPHGLGITPDGRLLLVTSEGSHRLYQFEIGRDVLLRTVTTTQSGAHMIALNKKGKRAYVANRDSGTVSVVTTRNLKIERHFEVGPDPEGIAVTPDDRWLLVALKGAAEMVMIEEGGERISSRLPTGQTPVRIAVTPDSATALVANRDSDDVTVVDLLERRVTRTVPVGKNPGGIAVDPRGTRAYVCNTGAGTVSVLAIPGFEVTDEIAVGKHPDGIVFTPRPGASE